MMMYRNILTNKNGKKNLSKIEEISPFLG